MSELTEERGSEYGTPMDNHGLTAALWEAYVYRRGKIDREAVCMMNILQKVSRTANPDGETTDDTLQDIQGYVDNLLEIRNA